MITGTERALASAGLLLAGLLGLGMSVCGGGFTVAALLAALASTPQERYGEIAIVVSLPSLLLGVLVLVVVRIHFKQLRRTTVRPTEKPR
jgi:hypothetical protein